ncbi:Tumor necrosis factor receptor superfamily member 9 [Camelus dromedarius]|uniref:Tumor necrosis factor receptor superfamily member 9 n=1 Tax=Camelus dromedarius TaxID=9838 RepID=A0A5N4DDH0_CAMDR|nr:Tumor necrosis factor receptor superfamily member 9 [Camelus dromedarius]
MQDFIMGSGYYNIVATVLLVLNFERTRSTQDFCSNCSAGIFRTKKACSPTSNAECECVSGFHCQGAGCTMCEEDCIQGQELTEEGCKDCSFGTFNDQKHGACQPWTEYV